MWPTTSQECLWTDLWTRESPRMDTGANGARNVARALVSGFECASDVAKHEWAILGSNQ